MRTTGDNVYRASLGCDAATPGGNRGQNPRALPALYFRLGGPAFYMTDNLARRFVFETAARARAVVNFLPE
jgi:hypothetical protein